MESLRSLTRIKEWRKEAAAHVFPTDAALEWFTRQNRERLIRAGALFPRLGRGGSFVHSERMDAEVMAILAGRPEQDAA